MGAAMDIWLGFHAVDLDMEEGYPDQFCLPKLLAVINLLFTNVCLRLFIMTPGTSSMAIWVSLIS